MSFGLVNFLLAVAPLVLLVVLLLLGRFPGEQAINRCRQAIRLLLAKVGGGVDRREFGFIAFAFGRGGQLLGDSLAGRGPPSGRLPQL